MLRLPCLKVELKGAAAAARAALVLVVFAVVFLGVGIGAPGVWGGGGRR